MSEIEYTKPSNFIRHIIDSDMTENKYGGRFQTRFPPEPNATCILVTLNPFV